MRKASGWRSTKPSDGLTEVAAGEVAPFEGLAQVQVVRGAPGGPRAGPELDLGPPFMGTAFPFLDRNTHDGLIGR